MSSRLALRLDLRRHGLGNEVDDLRGEFALAEPRHLLLDVLELGDAEEAAFFRRRKKGGLFKKIGSKIKSVGSKIKSGLKKVGKGLVGAIAKKAIKLVPKPWRTVAEAALPSVLGGKIAEALKKAIPKLMPIILPKIPEEWRELVKIAVPHVVNKDFNGLLNEILPRFKTVILAPFLEGKMQMSMHKIECIADRFISNLATSDTYTEVNVDNDTENSNMKAGYKGKGYGPLRLYIRRYDWKEVMKARGNTQDSSIFLEDE